MAPSDADLPGEPWITDVVVGIVSSVSAQTAWVTLTASARQAIRRAGPRDRYTIIEIARQSINEKWPRSLRLADEPISESFGNHWEIVFEKDDYRYSASHSKDKRGHAQVTRTEIKPR